MTRFHSIKVNDLVYWYLTKLEKKTKMSKQDILLNALALYRSYLTSKERFQATHDKLDKAVWYIIKLNYAVFAFRENPKQNYQNLIEIIQQIESRLGVDLSILKKVALDYLTADQITNVHKIFITNALKITAIDILEAVLSAPPSQG